MYNYIPAQPEMFSCFVAPGAKILKKNVGLRLCSQRCYSCILLLCTIPTYHLLFGAKRFERLAWANLPINIILGRT